MHFNSLVTTPFALGQFVVVAAVFLVRTFHMFSTDTPLTAIHLVQAVTVLLGAFAATVYFEEKSHAAFCQIKYLREELEDTQAKHSSVVDDLNKTAERKLANIEMNLYYTRNGLEDAKTVLEQTRKIAPAHFEFREALAKELTQTRAQRDWAAGSTRYCMDMLKEARRKASSQELVAWEMQNQIKFKANELRDMTLSLENIKKELALANKFSQEAQDEIDEQHVKIEEHEKLIEKKEKMILGLLEQIRGRNLGFSRMHSTIERSNSCADSVITKLENMNRDLTREVEYWRGMSQHWSSNNANTIHAMGSEINEVRGELAELDAENERLTRDLKAMVDRVESFDKEREATTNRIEQLEWGVVNPEVAKKEEKSFTEEVDDNSTRDEGDEKESPSWFLDGDSEDDGTAYELDKGSEEDESE
jgi:chromosome segregation ATPase